MGQLFLRDLYRRVSEDTAIPMDLVREVLQGYLSLIAEAIIEGAAVELPGIGKLQAGVLSARDVFNPQVGRKVRDAERRVVMFEPDADAQPRIVFRAGEPLCAAVYMWSSQVERQGDGDDRRESADEEGATSVFDPPALADLRRFADARVAAREGQAAFRDKLLALYHARCAVTGTDVADVLEAAHIVPYQGEWTNHIANGLILRSDIHLLFDKGLLAIDPGTWTVHVSSVLKGTAYWEYHRRAVFLPDAPACYPSAEALQLRLALFRP